MKHLALLAFIFLVSCSKSQDSYLAEAEFFENQGKYKEAIKVLDKAIEVDKNNLGAYINRGADKAALGNYKAAIIDYKKALEIDSINPIVLLNIGNNYKRLNDYRSSVHFYNLAEDFNGYLYSKNRTYQIAIQKDYQYKPSPLEVSQNDILYERGLAFYELEQYEKSLLDFSNIPYGIRSVDAQYMIGACLLELGKDIEACVEFKIAYFKGDKLAKSMLDKYCK